MSYVKKTPIFSRLGDIWINPRRCSSDSSCIMLIANQNSQNFGPFFKLECVSSRMDWKMEQVWSAKSVRKLYLNQSCNLI